MAIVIGLDVGIASLGWGVIDTEKNKIIDAGVRIFTAAENPKTGASLAEPRRIARSTRRRLSRRNLRLKNIRELFIKHNLFSSMEECQKVLADSAMCPWSLRYEALEKKLSKRELAKALYS